MLTYSTWQDAIARIAATDASDQNFAAIVPMMIDYAEQRIYRDLNLLAVRVTDASANLTANSRSFTIPTAKGTFITVTSVNVITPVGSTPANGTRNSLPSMPRNLVDFVAPTETAPASPSVPQMYFQQDQGTLVFGPAPDAAYNVEVIGTIRPTPLSQSQATTFLTTYLPDLFVAASMVFYSGYMRNFGSQSENPQMAISWEAQYQALLDSAKKEEIRKRYNMDTDIDQPAR